LVRVVEKLIVSADSGIAPHFRYVFLF